jgi:hypothetical protein
MRKYCWVVFVLLAASAFAQHEPVNKVFKDPNVNFEKQRFGYCNYSMMDDYFGELQVAWRQLPTNWQHASCWWGSKTNIFFLENGDVYYLDGPSMIEQACSELDEGFIRELGNYKGNIHENGMQYKTHHYIMLDYAPYSINICLPEQNREKFVLFFVGYPAKIQAPWGQGMIFNAGSALQLPFDLNFQSWSLFETVSDYVTYSQFSWQRSTLKYAE